MIKKIIMNSLDVYIYILYTYIFYNFSTLIRNVLWAANQHIRMISEGSRDTEDWSNDCWKFSLVITGKELQLFYVISNKQWPMVIVKKIIEWKHLWNEHFCKNFTFFLHEDPTLLWEMSYYWLTIDYYCVWLEHFLQRLKCNPRP